MFVSAYEDGLQVFSMKDPTEPEDRRALLHLRVQARQGFGGSQENGWQSTTSVMQGAFGVDVRNYDGLVAISDMRTGLHLFKMDGFNGWKGEDHGMPNISSVQDWDRGPKGTLKPKVAS